MPRSCRRDAWGVPQDSGSPQTRTETPGPGPGGLAGYRSSDSLCPLSSAEVLGVFPPFCPQASFLQNVLSDINRAIESILSDPGSPFPASACPAHSQLTFLVGKPTQTP